MPQGKKPLPQNRVPSAQPYAYPLPAAGYIQQHMQYLQMQSMLAYAATENALIASIETFSIEALHHAFRILELDPFNALATQNTSVLHLAVWAGRSTLVKALLSRPDIYLNLEHRDAHGNTALDLAIQRGDRKMMQILASNMLLAKEPYEKIKKAIPAQPAMLQLPPDSRWMTGSMEAVGYHPNPAGMCYGFAMTGLQSFYQGSAAVHRFDIRLEATARYSPKELHTLKGNLQAFARLDARLKKMHQISFSEWRKLKKQGQSVTPYDAVLAEFPALTHLLEYKTDPRIIITEILAFYEALELYQQTYRYPAWFAGIDCYRVSDMLALEKKRHTFTYPCCVYIKPTEASEKKDEEKTENAAQEALLFLSSQEDTGLYLERTAGSDALLQKLEQTPYARFHAKEAKQLGLLLPRVCQNGQDLSAASVLRSKKMEAEGTCLIETDIFSGLYTRQALKRYFSLLAQHAEQPIGLMLGNVDHAISIGYDPIQKKWTYFDLANHAKRYVLGEDAIAQEVFSSFSSSPFMPAIALETRVIQPTPDARRDVLLWRRAVEQELLTITPEKAVFLGEQNTSWLYIAARAGETKTVIDLLQAGAQIYINQPVGSLGDTPLLAAIQINHAPLVQILLEAGADPNQTDTTGLPPLYDAINHNNLEIAMHLLEKGAYINQLNTNGCTSLALAAHKGHTDMVRFLLAQGANPNCARIEKDLPLFHAIENGNIEIVQLLLMGGANPHIKNQAGKTPLGVAMQEGKTEIACYIRQFLRSLRTHHATHTACATSFFSPHPLQGVAAIMPVQMSLVTG